MRRALVSAIVVIFGIVPSTGCALGSGDQALDDAGGGDTEPHLKDGAVGDDTEPFEIGGDDTAPAADTGAVDDTASIFDVDKDACSITCTTCGDPDGCGGICKTGTCPGAGETCVDGTCSSCVPKCTTCGASDGCGGTCKTGACSGSSACVAGKCVAPTKSWLAPPSYPASWGAFARAQKWTIAAEAAATIYYTLDGSTPTKSSKSGASPLTFSVPTDGTLLKWFSDDGASEGVQQFTVQISTSLQSGYGWILEDVKLDGVSPVAVVSPGASLSGSANYQAFVGTGCPGCRQQLVYGFGNTPSGCIYDWSPGVWPGASGSGAIHLTAPSTAGVYKVNVAWALQLSCSDAMTVANPLGVKPTGEIGVVVVK